jgi:hypothetical protein
MRRHQHRLVAVAVGVLAATVTALAGPQRLAGPDPSHDVASVAAPVVLQDVQQTLNRVNESVTSLSKSSSDARAGVASAVAA